MIFIEGVMYGTYYYFTGPHKVFDYITVYGR